MSTAPLSVIDQVLAQRRRLMVRSQMPDTLYIGYTKMTQLLLEYTGASTPYYGGKWLGLTLVKAPADVLLVAASGERDADDAATAETADRHVEPPPHSQQ